LLTLIGFVPTAGLLLYTAKEQHGQDASGAQQEALRLARLIAGEHEGAIEAARQLVAMLAQLPDVRQQQPDRCNALVADLRRRYPRYANLGGLTLNGSVRRLRGCPKARPLRSVTGTAGSGSVIPIPPSGSGALPASARSPTEGSSRVRAPPRRTGRMGSRGSSDSRRFAAATAGRPSP